MQSILIPRICLPRLWGITGEKASLLLVSLHSELLGCAVAACLHGLLVNPKRCFTHFAWGLLVTLAHLEEEYNIKCHFSCSYFRHNHFIRQPEVSQNHLRTTWNRKATSPWVTGREVTGGGRPDQTTVCFYFLPRCPPPASARGLGRTDLWSDLVHVFLHWCWVFFWHSSSAQHRHSLLDLKENKLPHIMYITILQLLPDGK